MKKVLAGMMVLGMMLGAGAWSAGEVQAACGYGIRAGVWGEEGYLFAACGRGESEDGKIKVEEGRDSDAKVTIITLNNYDGKGIVAESCGSYGFTTEYFVVNLIGENRITEENGIGVGLGRVKFVGEGTLTVTAMVPVSGGMLCDYCTTTTEERCPGNWLGVDKGALEKILGTTTLTIAPAKGVISEVVSDDLVDCGGDPEDGAGSTDASQDEKVSDDALIGPTEEQATGSSAKIGWMIGGIVAGVYIVGSLIAFVVIGVKGRKRKTAEKATEVGAANGGVAADSASGDGSGDNLGSEE